MKDGTSARDPARIPERSTVEVADPHADRDVTRVANRPVVVVRLGRSSLRGHGKWEVQAAAPAEHVVARFGVRENVGDPERGAWAHEHVTGRPLIVGEVARGDPFTAAG